MKKLILSLVAMLSIQLSLNAQTIIKNNYDSPITSADGSTPTSTNLLNGFCKGSDINITANIDQKLFGFSFLTDFSDFAYGGFGIQAGFGDYSSYLGNFSAGLGKRYVFSDAFLLQGKIGAYAGYSSYDYPSFSSSGKETTETKNEFAYGANANICAGLKLWTTKKGNSTFITVGNYGSAQDSKPKGMMDNGQWGIGFTTIFN